MTSARAYAASGGTVDSDKLTALLPKPSYGDVDRSVGRDGFRNDAADWFDEVSTPAGEVDVVVDDGDMDTDEDVRGPVETTVNATAPATALGTLASCAAAFVCPVFNCVRACTVSRTRSDRDEDSGGIPRRDSKRSAGVGLGLGAQLGLKLEVLPCVNGTLCPRTPY